MSYPLKFYRKAYRSWRNKRRLEKEGVRYRGEFERLGLVLPDADAICRAVKARRPDLSPVPRGSLRTLAIFHDYNWERTALLPALEKFGEVVHYDWRDRYAHGKKEWRKGLKEEMNRDLFGFARTLMCERPVHVFFTYLSGELVTPATMRELSTLGAPIVNLSLNDKEAFTGRVRAGLATGVRDICRSFDLCWTSTRDALEKYCVEGATPLYLPEGANPEVHRPFDVEKTIDVSFVGQCYGNRPAVIDALRNAGIRVETFGPGWTNGPLPTGEMVRTYSRSHVNLGFGGVAGHKDTYCLKGRDFEVPMSGGLYLTEAYEELEQFYEVGKEIVTWSGVEDLVEKIRWLLSNPEAAAAIRQAGHRRALSGHTWEMRFDRVFRVIGALA
ncbi:glycosyltransferase [Candidatus Deferrimicrobium sp.]|uniref:CgeB family protein n=1 Tax=Candidatus Deferrimicrobium sp. TaxID=3060586 RepID=UPI002715AD02|nr:glycosyltransferase [Candidatus Deferrimicrobium sp.]MDO8738396.1 glycosyltransferase [Candidatus Deferrimicrobium sp.]